MKFRVLGPVCATGGGGATARLSMRKQRQLLAVLVVRGGLTCGSEWLQDTVYGPGRADMRQADTALRTLVYRLRAALDKVERDRLQTEPKGYRLEVRPGEDDVSAFRARVEAGLAARDRHDFQAADRTLASALKLWCNPPLPDLPFTFNGDDLRRELTDQYLLAQDAYYDVQLELWRHREIIPKLRALSREHPIREHTWAQLAMALYRSGERTGAMQELSAIRAGLISEYGADVGPELQQLTQQVSRDDPELMMPIAGRAASWEPVCQLPAADPRYLPDPLRAEAALESLCGPGVPVVVIAGPGSSEFATHLAYRASRRFPDGQLYVPLTTARGTARYAADVLAGQLASLGVPPQAIPRDEPERAGRLRALLSGRRVLVFADGARTADQVKSLIPGGDPSAGGCAVLVAASGPLTRLVPRASLTIDLHQPPPRQPDRPRSDRVMASAH